MGSRAQGYWDSERGGLASEACLYSAAIAVDASRRIEAGIAFLGMKELFHLDE